MLKLVHDTWVKGVLEKSLYNEVLIELGMKRAEDAVVNPWDMVIHVPGQEERQLPKGAKIVDVFDEMNQSLLILGEPGSGKTTMLLELARDAIARAQQDDTLPMPVVFNLSSWAEKRQPLEDWMVDEFNSKYGIPRKLAQLWLEQDEVLLLLDGLDEVRQEQRRDCVTAINAFRQNHLVGIAICSRIAEYKALATQLELKAAIVLLPLSPQQIDDYLCSVGDSLQAARKVLQQDATLTEFVQSPLTLSIMTLAYQDRSLEEIQVLESVDARRKRLFDAYISNMFAPTARTLTELYSMEQTIHWLQWLAGRMMEHSQPEFLIERLQPDWLQVRTRIRLYGLIVGLIFGLIFGLISGLIYGLIFGLIGGLIFGLIFGLPLGLIVGLIVGLIYGLIVGLSFELPRGLDDIEPVYQLSLNWQVRLIFGLPLGLKSKGTFQTTYPNQRIWQSARNMLIVGLTIGLVGGLIGGLVGGLIGGLVGGLVGGLTVGLITGLEDGGGRACIQHLILRTLLWRYDYAPLNYARFLDYCHDLVFLRKVGGGYIFIHRMLLEHFAEMTDEEIAEKFGQK